MSVPSRQSGNPHNLEGYNGAKKGLASEERRRINLRLNVALVSPNKA